MGERPGTTGTGYLEIEAICFSNMALRKSTSGSIMRQKKISRSLKIVRLRLA